MLLLMLLTELLAWHVVCAGGSGGGGGPLAGVFEVGPCSPIGGISWGGGGGKQESG